MFNITKKIFFVLSLLITITSAMAYEQEQFIEEYVSAINKKNIYKIKELTHPKCIERINEKNRDYYDDHFSKEVNKTIPDSYKITKVSEILDDKTLMMEKMFSYPARPTHWVQLDYEESEFSSTTILRQVVKYNGNWKIIIPDPTEETLTRIREQKIKDQKHKMRARELFAKLEEPLLSEYKTLLGKHMKIEAWKKYSSESGESIYMAKTVLSLIPLEKK